MLLTLIVFLLILSVLVLVHEFGHFFAAKKLGIRVEEFGIGLPPRIFGIKLGETVYSVNYLPIGGFVRLYGEEGLAGKDSDAKTVQKRAFFKRPVWQRSLVIVAGVLMNFLLAVVVISYLFTQGVMVPVNRVHIEKVISDTPAAIVGLKEGDIIKNIKFQTANSQYQIIDIKTGDQLSKTTKDYLGKDIILVIERNGKILELGLVPRLDYPQDQGPMGIVISNYEEKRYSLSQAPIMGLKESLVLSWELAKGIGNTLWKMIMLKPVSKDVAGPIGIAQMTGEAIKFGENAVLEMLGLLSLNLAIINILPFPALDGGRLLFVVIEGATGKKVKTNWERYIHQFGMAILLFLVILVTINDLMRFFSK